MRCDENGEGEIEITAQNITATGADINNQGRGKTKIKAKEKASFTALHTSSEEQIGTGNHTQYKSTQGVVISQVQGEGDVEINAKDIYSEGAAFDAKMKTALIAENNEEEVNHPQ